MDSVIHDLSIERVWEDAHMFEVEIAARSEHLCAKARTYLPFDGLDDLADGLERLSGKKNDTFFWEAGDCGAVCSYISLFFAPNDKQGHIRVEIHMEISDQFPESKHNCRLAFCTEVGLLRSFGNRLRLLRTPGVGRIVRLYDGIPAKECFPVLLEI